MIIDIIVLLIAIFSIFKGYKKGFIAAIFSFAGLIIIMAAGIPLSIQIAKYFGGNTNNAKPWLPIASFLLVTIIIMLLMKWIAALISTAFNWTLLGGINRLAGVCLFAFIYLTIISIILFYAIGSNIVSPHIIQTSYTAQYLIWWGNKSIEILSAILPFLKASFTELKNYFTHNSFSLSCFNLSKQK